MPPIYRATIRSRPKPHPIAISKMISETERKFIQALMLAITAPTDELAFECMGIAESIGSDLTEKQIDLAQMGVEVALEALRRVKK